MMSRKNELLSELLAIQEMENPGDRLMLHGAINDARRARDSARAMSAHPNLPQLEAPESIEALRDFIRHLREPITESDREFGQGAMEDCLIPLWEACDREPPSWPQVLCGLRRVVRKIHATTAQDHVGPIEGIKVLPMGDPATDAPSPCWIPVTVDGKPARPAIKCACGALVDIADLQVHRQGVVSPTFHHARAIGGCGWSGALRLQDYTFGDFLPASKG